jgi:hypothetical protein
VNSINHDRSDLLVSIKGIVFLAICFVCWAFSSPAGSGPDEGWHIGSIYCAFGENYDCDLYELASASQMNKMTPKTGDSLKLGSLDVIIDNKDGSITPSVDVASVPWSLDECFRWNSSKSANCGSIDDRPSRQDLPSDRDAYPSGYYKTMNVLTPITGVGKVLLVRVINLSIFLILFLLFILNCKRLDKVPVLTAITMTLVPLAMFIIPSVNPSSWSYSGIIFNWVFLNQLLSNTKIRSSSGYSLIVGWFVAFLLAVSSRYENILIVAAISFITVFSRYGLKTFLKLRIAVGIFVISGMLAISLFVSKFGVISRNKFGDSLSQIGVVDWIFHWIVRLPEVPIQVFGTGGLGWLDTFVPFVVPAIGLSLFVSAFLFSFINYDRKQILVVISTVLFLASVILSQAFEYRSLMNNNIQGRYVLSLVTFLLGISIYVSRSPIQLFEIKALRHFTILAISFIHMLSLFVNTQRYVNGVSQSFSPMILTDTSWWWTNSPIGPNFLVILGSLSFFLFLRFIWSTVPLKSLDSLKF